VPQRRIRTLPGCVSRFRVYTGGLADASPVRGGLAVAAVFFCAAIALSGVLPLWLDEIIQLRETRNTTPAQLMASLPGQPGAAPLGYLTQQAVLRTTGYSVLWARFPSAVFMAGTVFLVALIGGELAAMLFALFPLTLRYACESRIYSEALFFSTLSTLLFIRIIKSPSWVAGVLYCLAMTAAVYTQPYAVFVVPAHFLWAVIDRKGKAAAFSIASAFVAVAAFIPWYWFSKTNWSSGIAGAGVRFVFSAKTPLMLFREVAGAGYWGSGLLLILCAMAIWGKSRRAGFLLLLIGVPVVLALAADAMFGYFVATRQILWVLPAIAVLAAQGIARNYKLAVLVAAFCLWPAFRYFTAPHENWQVAADALAAEVRRGACMVVVPREQAYSYEFFRPELADASCPAARTAVAFTPYATVAQQQAAVAALTAQGYTKQSGYSSGKSDIALFSR
jgi:Dolichyl-phosphate-mannose-protein mannosyltransferase